MQEIEEMTGTIGMAMRLGMWLVVVYGYALVMVVGSERQPGGRYSLRWNSNWSLYEGAA